MPARAVYLAIGVNLGGHKEVFGLWISQTWRRNWARITQFFDYPPEIRKAIYTTNAIESINMSLRQQVIKTRASFLTDDAVSQLFYLALNNISKKWTMLIRDWKAVKRFTIQFEDRLLPV